MSPKVRPNPNRYLKIQDSPLERTPVHVVAMYSGELGQSFLTEFKRRYGYMDYVVLQHRDASGTPVGRVYAWNGNSAGANSGLAAARPGAMGVVQDDAGKILFSGDLAEKHDFLEAVPRKTALSPDGRYSALLCEAGFPGLNLLLVRNLATGQEVRWQAGSRSGDLYLDAFWVGPALLTFEGKPEDRQLFQIHDDGHYVREVLGADQLREDAAASGLELAPIPDPTVVATRPNGEALSYKARFTLADGNQVERIFEGRLALDARGRVRLIDRREVAPDLY